MNSLLIDYHSKRYDLSYYYNSKFLKEESQKNFIPLITNGDVFDVLIQINSSGGKIKNDFYGGVELIVKGEPPIKEVEAIRSNIERLNLSSRWVKYSMSLMGDGF
jgi:hypothetical protein